MTPEVNPLPAPRDHGGGIDAARTRWGGERSDWLDLSTGINPQPYPTGTLSPDAWQALPDRAAQHRLEAAARRFWQVPERAALVAAPGASALIARMPHLVPHLRGSRDVLIEPPTYNEHAGAFATAGWRIREAANAHETQAAARVVVHPNNPTGALWDGTGPGTLLTVIDESFCDIDPSASLIGHAIRPGHVILKSFGKFWGLAGLRLGFAIGDPQLIAALAQAMGPWSVSGPALTIGARALEDAAWARTTRHRLIRDALRLDALMQARGHCVIGGTTLFRLYDVGDAAKLRDRLAQARVWTRVFPYSARWMRLGLPGSDAGWDRLSRALGGSPDGSAVGSLAGP